MSDRFFPMEKTRDHVWVLLDHQVLVFIPVVPQVANKSGCLSSVLRLLPICLGRFSHETCKGLVPQHLCRRVSCPHLSKTLHLNHVLFHHSSHQPSSALPETLHFFSKPWFWQICSLRILHLSLPGSTAETEKKKKGFGFWSPGCAESFPSLIWNTEAAHYPSLPRSHKPRLSPLPPRMDGWVQRKHQ